MAHFAKNQERWLYSVDFLRRGEIAEKGMVVSRPNTDGHPDLDGRTYASLDRLSKLNLVKFLKDHYSP